MNLIKPKALKPGDTIGLLSCAGNVEDIKSLESAKKYFESQSYRIKISPNSFHSYNYLSGSDEARLEALSEFFVDDTVDAILAVRGGYGSLRLIKDVDYELIKNHSKIFAGFSDITALSLMFYKKCGLITFSSPMALSDFSGEIDKITERAFFETLKGETKIIPLLNSPLTYNEGAAQGILWGGNLTVIASLAGQDFIPNEKFILFIEDINEPVYKIDRCLTQLMNIDSFKENLSGIILGDFSGVDERIAFDSLFFKFKKEIPIKSGLKIGHEKTKMTLPVGIKCSFDTSKKYLEFLEDYLT